MIAPRRLLAAALALTSALLASCGSGGIDATPCTGDCATATPQKLDIADVQAVIAQAVAEARARNAAATIAVVDRVGNVLGVFRMTGANPGTLRLDSGRNVRGGLDGLEFRTILRSLDYPDVQGGVDGVAALMAIAKAITGAYLSSEGNAFSTRTASQIVQEFFNVGEVGQPAGPLFGVQFSQLACSDLMTRFTGARPTPGPHHSPLGLSADAGGFPLYKAGTLVGGVGVLADGVYGLDLDITDVDSDLDELVALAATRGYDAPDDRRADRITADGKTFRYSDARVSDLRTARGALGFAAVDGPLGQRLAIPGYTESPALVAGLAFPLPESGVRAASTRFGMPDPFQALDGFELVDATNANRFPPRAGTDGALLGAATLTAAEVTALLEEGLKVASRARAQIRRPLGSPAAVSLSVVDSFGQPLGFVRSRDAPMFGSDVSLQKARSAMFFSHPDAGRELLAAPDTTYIGTGAKQSIAATVPALRAFFDRADLLTGTVAFAERSIGNLARPYFPDGIRGADTGPLSKPIEQWSPFNLGLQLDLANDAILQHLLFVLGVAPDVTPGSCAPLPSPLGNGQSRLANGLQIFAGGVPLYRGNVLVGGFGISGDGIDQDDMVAFLGTANAGARLNTGLGNAPASIRADRLRKDEVFLRYVQCPQAPFLDSSEQSPCAGR